MRDDNFADALVPDYRLLVISQLYKTLEELDGKPIAPEEVCVAVHGRVRRRR